MTSDQSILFILPQDFEGEGGGGGVRRGGGVGEGGRREGAYIYFPCLVLIHISSMWVSVMLDFIWKPQMMYKF